MKPRFILGSKGQLQLVPIPELTEEEYLRVVGIAAPSLALDHESFQPRGPMGIVENRFPFSVSLSRALAPFVWEILHGQRMLAELYQPDHPTQALQITAAIIEAFWRDALEAGKNPQIVIFPTIPELSYQRKYDQASYQNLLESLDRKGLKYLDLGPPMVRYLGSRDVRAIFKAGGHYNEEANDFVAKNVYRYLQNRGAI